MLILITSIRIYRMAFKVPLPVMKKIAQPQPNENELLGLPSFDSKDYCLVLIGKGTFGKAYKAVKGESVFIIKKLRQTNEFDKKLFFKEAQLLKSTAGQENIVQIHGYSSVESSILLEYCTFQFTKLGGGIEHDRVSNLAGYLHAYDALCDCNGFEHTQYFLALDIISGLMFLHNNAIVHRDLKPENILVSNRHYEHCNKEDVVFWWASKPIVAKLTDFGEARSSAIQTNTVLQTKAINVNRGTAVYLAPEVLLNKIQTANTDQLKQIDVWALGLVFYQLMCPDRDYPFQHEMSESGILDANDVLKQCVGREQKPLLSTKYEEKQSSEWKFLVLLFEQCCMFASGSRPSATDVCQR